METHGGSFGTGEMEIAIRLDKVVKRFGAQTVLKGIDLEIEKGRVTVIIGRSGGGKSVLLRHLLGLIKPDEGQIYFGDRDITRMTDVETIEHLKTIGMLFQNAALFDSMTVLENVAFPLIEHRKMKMKEARSLVEETLESVGLTGVLQKYPSQLSGGMQKRVGLARAIILQPEILFYDEPTTGLDPIMTAVVDELIRETQQRHGHTAVVISHDMRATMRIAHHIAMLYEGGFIFYGTPEELQRSQDPRVVQFLEGRAAEPAPPAP